MVAYYPLVGPLSLGDHLPAGQGPAGPGKARQGRGYKGIGLPRGMQTKPDSQNTAVFEGHLQKTPYFRIKLIRRPPLNLARYKGTGQREPWAAALSGKKQRCCAQGLPVGQPAEPAQSAPTQREPFWATNQAPETTLHEGSGSRPESEFQASWPGEASRPRPASPILKFPHILRGFVHFSWLS